MLHKITRHRIFIVNVIQKLITLCYTKVIKFILLLFFYFQVYGQDCETFGMVVQMLIAKDPSLENTIQFALRENLREIGERCIEELRAFITQYDSAPGEHLGRS